MSSKPNILFLLHLPPPVHGSSLVGKNIETSLVINENFNCSYVNLLASKEISETGKVNLNKVMHFLRTWVKLFKKLLTKKPDLCYFALTATGSAFYRDVLLIGLLKLFGVDRVYHLHNKGILNNQRKLINYIFYRYVFKDVNVILLSEYLYSDVESFVSKKNVFICPNGIYNENKTLNIKTLNIIPKILFLSNLIESKGVFLLLEACALLKNKGILFQCDFIGGEGDLSLGQFQETCNHLGLTKIAKYHGKRFGEEKLKALANADIFAFPTYYPNECFPLVLLEAMQYGLPIVTTDEGGIKDIVEEGKNGFIVPQKNIEVLAEKLELLIKDEKLRERMGEEGCRKFKREFTLDQFENKLVSILHKHTTSN